VILHHLICELYLVETSHSGIESICTRQDQSRANMARPLCILCDGIFIEAEDHLAGRHLHRDVKPAEVATVESLLRLGCDRREILKQVFGLVPGVST